MISKITNELLDSLMIECKKEENINKLKMMTIMIVLLP